MRSLRLHLTIAHSSNLSGLRFALFGVTVFPAEENTLSDFELAAGTAKTNLAREGMNEKLNFSYNLKCIETI